MRMTCAAILAALFVMVGASSLRAEDVTLTSRDGSVEISGNLLAFDGEFYRLDTIYGELTVDGSGVSCVGPGCPNLEAFVVEVVLSGAATMATRLLPALLDGFAAEMGGAVEVLATEDPSEQVHVLTNAEGRATAQFVLRTRTSAEGFADLLANEADIIMSTREIRPTERKRAMDAGFGDMAGTGRSRVLALDGLVPIVHPNNPVSSVSASDLADILAGRVVSWETLGGVEAPISLHALSPQLGLAQRVEDQILAVSRRPLSDTAAVYQTVEDMQRAILRDPFGLAVVGYSNVGQSKPLALEGGCGFALAANARTLKTEDYPLTVPLFLYFPARRLPKPVRDFLRFTRSDAAERIVFAQGFVDQAQEAYGIDVQGVRLANAIRRAGGEVALADVRRMVNRLYTLRRLTPTFRFETGATQLDAQSRSNVAALAEALERGDFDARRLVFVGFSDGEGSADANLRIAQRRAEEVRSAVREAAAVANFDAVQLDVDAFGEALPMACDDTAWGRQTNRRVEVWVD